MEPDKEIFLPDLSMKKKDLIKYLKDLYDISLVSKSEKIEGMEIDLDKGDEILTGKFKNHKTTVKKIGTDDLGQPTVNDKSMLKFRVAKLMPKKEEQMQEELKEASRSPEEMQAQLDAVNEQLDGTIGEYSNAVFWKSMSPLARNAWQKKVSDLERQKSRLERRLAGQPVLADAEEVNADFQTIREEEGETENPEDVIQMDVPFLIRVMEYAKEDAKTDLDLHDAAEKMVNFSKEGSVLKMENYESIFGAEKVEAPATPIKEDDVADDVYTVVTGDDLGDLTPTMEEADEQPIGEMRDVLALDITKRFLTDVNAGGKPYTQVEGLPIDTDDLNPDLGSSTEEILFHLNTNQYGPKIEGWIEIGFEWYYSVKKSKFKGDYNQPPDPDETDFRGININKVQFYDDASGTDIILPVDSELEQLILQLVKGNISL